MRKNVHRAAWADLSRVVQRKLAEAMEPNTKDEAPAHEPDAQARSKAALDQQDKRRVIPLAAEDYDTWLAGTVNDAKALLRLSPADVFSAAPV